MLSYSYNNSIQILLTMNEVLKAGIKGQKSKLTNESIKRLRVFKLDDSELNHLLNSLIFTRDHYQSFKNESNESIDESLFDSMIKEVVGTYKEDY